jgi:hypothetical protein
MGRWEDGWFPGAAPVSGRFAEDDMTIKDVLVHLDASTASAPRLGVALGLAKRYAAHLVGLFAIEIEPMAFTGAGMGVAPRRWPSC